MKSFTKAALAFALSAALFANGADAQQPGDIIATSIDDVHTIDRNGAFMSTLASSRRSIGGFMWVRMHSDNKELIIGERGFSTSELLRTNLPSTSLGTVGVLPSITGGAAVDQDGEWILSTNAARLMKIKGTSTLANPTTLMRIPIGGYGITIDEDNGDYIIAGAGRNGASLVRIRRDSNVVSTLINGLRGPCTADHCQKTGRIFGTQLATPGVFTIDRNGQINTFGSLPSATAVKVDDLTGNVIVAHGKTVTEFDSAGRVIRTHGPYSSASNFNGLEIYGSRKITPKLQGSPTPNGTYQVRGNFIESPNQSYACGVSLGGMRPGITVGGQTLNIVADNLFFATVEGRLFPLTIGFRGVTDQNGRFDASFVLPELPLAAPTLIFAAGAVNPTKPGRLDFAPSISITVLD